MNRIIGQIIGLIASGVSFLNPIYKKKWQMLVNNTFVNILLGLNLVFLGQFGSGIFLFVLSAIQSVVNLVHILKDRSPSAVEKVVFFVLYVGLGLYGIVTMSGFVPELNWQNIIELLPIGGAVCSMCFVFTRKEQTARAYLLCCDSLWSIYYVCIRSSALVGTLVSVTMCALSILRYRKKK